MNIKCIATSLVCAALSACGGGEGGEACEHGGCNTPINTGVPTPQPPTVTMTVAVTSAVPLTASVSTRTPSPLMPVTGTWSITGAMLTTLPCMVLSDPNGNFTQVSSVNAASNGSFSLVPDFPVSSFAPVTVVQGSLTVKAYADTTCMTPYIGGSATVAYTITVN